MRNLSEERCNALAFCTYMGKEARGVPVALLDMNGSVLERKPTGAAGLACLGVAAVGEYIVRAWSPRPSRPRAIYCRVFLEPDGCVPVRFVFRKPIEKMPIEEEAEEEEAEEEELVYRRMRAIKPLFQLPAGVAPIHTGPGSIQIQLRDSFYKLLPLAGGVYQLWQIS